jgi:Cu2+-exporting ATPase
VFQAIVNGKKVVAGGPNYFTLENKPVPEIPNEIDQNTETGYLCSNRP